MEKFTLSQESHASISQLMDLANEKLRETPEQRFERNFRDLILKEIENGLKAANSFKAMLSGSHTYTYTNDFPLPIYEALTEESLLILEQSSIYLGKSSEFQKATIRIIFHF